MIILTFTPISQLIYKEVQSMRRLPVLLVTSTALALSYKFSCQTEPIKIKPTPPKFKTRQDHLKEINTVQHYDVVVIGGGCNGAGVLLEASTRGLKSLMIEKDDFGSGTSSKSTKLIHGGVRYLQQVFQFSWASLASRKEKFDLVKEAITERSLMLDSASHLTSKVPFVIPCPSSFHGLYYYLGSLVYYFIYEFFAPLTPTIFRAPYFMNRQQLLEVFPNLNPKFSTGVVYEDGSFNDSRFLLASILTATQGNGLRMPPSFVPANALNRAQFIDFIKDKDGKMQGVVFKDLLTGKQYKVKAKYVINCTGAFADQIRLKDDPTVHKRICIVGGSHIVYDSRVASSSFGICIPSSDGRIILVQPWLGRVLAGTTQKKFSEPTNNPICTDQERSFINESLNEVMSEMPADAFLDLQRTRWSGLRPLVVDDADHPDTKSIARNHVIEQQKSGLLSLMGGKWTTYRKMGQDIVDLLAEKQKKQGKEIPQTQTKGLPLLGSAPETLRTLMVKEKGHVGAQLYHTFGWLAEEVSKGDLRPVYGSTSLAQLEWIVKNEMVTDIEDVLMRRTRLCFLIPKREVLSLAGLVGKLLQKQQKWSDKQTQQKIDRSIERILSYEFQ